MAAFLFILFVLTSASVSAQKVDVVSMEPADFGSYESYSFQPFLVLATKEPWRNSIVERSITEAITSEFGKKGLERVDESPDVYVAVYLGIEQGGWVDGFNAWTPRQRGSNERTSVNEAVALTRRKQPSNPTRKGIGVIDLVDAKTDTVVWRAYCSARVGDGDDREKKIHKAVTKAFKKYPPK
jgi:hypothetical protein